MAKRQKCEECGDYKDCNEIGLCHDCIQDNIDLDDEHFDEGFDEDWLPEDDMPEDEVEY